MRIISGTAKGKKILLPADKKTRPMKDMVRESIFNILNHSSLLNKELKNSIILDLFSGTGSFGLEAISRGVKKVIFFDDYKPAIDMLIRNLNNLKFKKKAEVYKKDIYKKGSLKKLSNKFDLIFLDPPFKDDKLEYLMNLLYDPNILSSSSLVIIHRNKKSLDEIQKNFKIVREEIYGSSKIIFGFFIF
tara:strand:+ start:82 stop:648 length:567 start_codon:yes stop_codon:yes gene_type:complete